MRLATLLSLAFSLDGLLILLLFLCTVLLVRPRLRFVRVALIAVVVWYTVISIYPIPHAISRGWSARFAPLSKADVPPGRSAIAVLGSGAYTAVDWRNATVGVPDPIGLERTLEAARIYALLDPAWVISSGGFARPNSLEVSPAVAMKETLVRLGVPASRIIVRDQALDTHDEALNVARLVATLGIDHVVLVTSGIHMRRALATFGAAGVRAIPAPARDETSDRLSWRTMYLPTERGLYEASLIAHEIAGSLYYRVRGWQDSRR